MKYTIVNFPWHKVGLDDYDFERIYGLALILNGPLPNSILMDDMHFINAIKTMAYGINSPFGASIVVNEEKFTCFMLEHGDVIINTKEMKI